MLDAIAVAIRQAGDTLTETSEYRGGSDWLVLFGAGAEVHHLARNRQVKAGGRAMLWDLGYFGRQKVTGFLRMSIDSDHCQQWLDKTNPAPGAWAYHGIELREDADPRGPIILVGLGRKSRKYLRADLWEVEAYARIQKQYPGRRVIYRPKPGHDSPSLPCERDDHSPIEQLLRGASLVVCHHSNVAVDAVVAGVPFDAVDGAAMWLVSKEFSPANRLDFLCRLAWWQWQAAEAGSAWSFAKGIVNG